MFEKEKMIIIEYLDRQMMKYLKWVIESIDASEYDKSEWKMAKWYLHYCLDIVRIASDVLDFDERDNIRTCLIDFGHRITFNARENGVYL